MEYVLNLMENQSVDVDVRKAIPWFLWSIWKNRNAVIYAHTQEALEVVVKRTVEEASIGQRLMRKETEMRYTFNKDLCIDRGGNLQIQGYIKCNIHTNWRNTNLLSGVAWIARDHYGQVTYHARNALTPSRKRIDAELRGIVWSLESLRDLRIRNVVLAMDSTLAFQAVSNPHNWPRYRLLLHDIECLFADFNNLTFELEAQSSNAIACDIAKSVLRDGRFQSYLALGGPSWLHDRLENESVGNTSFILSH